MERYLIEDVGDDELGINFDIKEVDDHGKLTHVATFFDRRKAEEFIGARRWVESLAEFKMLGEVPGFKISPETGRMTKRRTPQVAPTKKKAPK